MQKTIQRQLQQTLPPALMQTFYKKMLQEHQNPVVAMRAAQLEMWNSGKAPYNWAAFTIQGEWQ